LVRSALPRWRLMRGHRGSAIVTKPPT